MSEPFLGEIRLFSFTHGPKGWALCNGQFMHIEGNQELFSLLGTTYGGDGITTFALPDLRRRVPVHSGNGIELGEKGSEKCNTQNVSGIVTKNLLQPYTVANYCIALEGVNPKGNSDNIIEPFIGEIRIFAGKYPPRGWALCNGQFLSTEQYPELFNVLETRYGCEDKGKFAIPDFRGRVAIQHGGELGLIPRVLEEDSGDDIGHVLDCESVKLNCGSNHEIAVSIEDSADQPLNNIIPYLGLNFIIALYGI